MHIILIGSNPVKIQVLHNATEAEAKAKYFWEADINQHPCILLNETQALAISEAMKETLSEV